MSTDINEKIDQAYKKMSKSHKLLARFVIDHGNEAAFLTAGALGKRVGVSESTVVRFAMWLGYEGYPELQKELQEILRSRLTGTQRLELSDGLSGTKLVEKVLKTDIDNIHDTMDKLDNDEFDGIVESIVAAKRIYVMGVRASEIIAKTLGLNLDLILDNVRTITESSNDDCEQLIHIKKGDVFVGISFPRYSKRTADAMLFAKNHGARCIAITDSSLSLLMEYADQKIEVRCNTVSFVDSLVAPLSVINALIAAVSMKKKNEFSETLAEMETIWKKNHFYAAKK